MKPITENNIETFAINLLQDMGWIYKHGLDIVPGSEHEERQTFEQVVLIKRLKKAISLFNPDIPEFAQEQAIQKLIRLNSQNLMHNNEIFHQFIIEQVKIPYHENGYERSYDISLIDFENISNNDFLVVNQFTVTENNRNKRADIILFVNGLPLVIIELKNAIEEKATIHKAYEQLQTYKEAIPNLFTYNEICIISDGLDCRAGSITSNFSRFMAWKTSDGTKEDSRFIPQLETLIKGMLNPKIFLDLIKNFIVFEKSKKIDSKTGLTQISTEKKISAYHQYYAVNKAVEKTLLASSENGNRKGGVVWHTQGSGKSLSMVFYTGKIVLYLNNPTIVVITDRNDLDDQLFSTFSSAKQLLRQEPVQAKDRNHLKELLKVASGGIVFTTIQKFTPESGEIEYERLSDRTNIVVIADEAHRTQYGFKAKLVDEKDKESKEVLGKRISYGFAKYMRDALPNATYIGFTGTPIESTDINTPQVFGEYIDIYDISQAVSDGATVKIYYESRLAKVNIDDEGKELIKEYDSDISETDENLETNKAKSKWTRLEAIIGSKERIKIIANDIVNHFEQRQKIFDGKSMIVSMSRRIAVELYKEIINLRPDWYSDDLSKGVIKVIMTASSDDGAEMSKHHTSKSDRRLLSERMKDPSDSLKIVIVRDMWLTGFDAPCLHTLYIDKPMKSHNLMQAIARVNRVFKDKTGGLIVDYLGIFNDLKSALSFYSDAGGKGEPAETQDQAIELFNEKLEVIRQLFYTESRSYSNIMIAEPKAYYGDYPNSGFNYKSFFESDSREKLSIILQAEEHILGLPDGKERYIREVDILSKALTICISRDEVKENLEEVAFFQAVKSRLVKFDTTETGKSKVELETAIKQIVDNALISEKVIDIFDAAGIEKPDVSILSDEFLLEVKNMKHKNLAFELLKKLLNNEIKSRSKTNLVKSKSLLEMLENSIRKYQNNLLTTSEIIQELIDIAKEIKKVDGEGKKLGLEEDEVAFYNALELNDSAVSVMGDEQLRIIAKEIADKVRKNATIDWTIRESSRAKLMVLVRRTLNKYGYPPDKQQKAIDTILKQAELMADLWTTEKN